MRIKRNEMKKKFIAMCLCIAVVIPMYVGAATYESYEDLIAVKQTSHEIANKARELSLDDSHEIIAGAKELWHEADNKLANKQYSVPMVTYYSNEDVLLLAQMAYCEARGLKSKTEIACVMWTILNRHDAGYGSIKHIITAPNQYAY